jgi:exopolysaccharide biosynthesis predicted pyruvyltransferase EpsI
MANPGNLGDALIRQGTLKLFEEIGLSFKEVCSTLTLDVGTFIYGGGGAWCQNWNHARFVDEASIYSHPTIVLPSTYAMMSNLYRRPWMKFFTRDNSLSYLFCPRARFHHDLAFMLEKSLMPKKGAGVGYFFRTDKESARHEVPRGNVDISLWGETYDDTQPFIDAVNAVREVHTDRLHVAIVACMLEKRVNFYPGNYWKNEAAYNASMKGRYDVTFREHDR